MTEVDGKGMLFYFVWGGLPVLMAFWLGAGCDACLAWVEAQ